METSVPHKMVSPQAGCLYSTEVASPRARKGGRGERKRERERNFVFL
jgi:hypothetical protein